MRRLEDMLRDDYGINTGIRLAEARDVSADGRVIVGAAFISYGENRGFVVTLPSLALRLQIRYMRVFYFSH